jgi:ferrous iron transport protein A
MHLVDLKIGEEKKVKLVDGCYNFRLRMRELGIIEGSNIKVVSGNKEYGPILVSVNGSKFGIGRGVANKILIKDY